MRARPSDGDRDVDLARSRKLIYFRLFVLRERATQLKALPTDFFYVVGFCYCYYYEDRCR